MNIKKQMKMFEKILVLSPHPDDGELGCGGTMAKLIEDGKDVYYATFSLCEKSIPPGYPKDILKSEVKKATHVLGIKKDNLIIYNYEVREFPKLRQEILETLILIGKDIQPDVIFTPSLNDLHQDHITITEESLRAFKKCTILGYEQPWNNITFNTLAFIPLEEQHIRKKIDALKCYETQKNRDYVCEKFMIGIARTRGTPIIREYAEAFDVMKWIINL